MLAVGSIIGGLTIALLGRDLAFVINSLSFFASAFFVWRIHRSFSEHRAIERKGLNPFADFAEGLGYAWQRPQVFWLLTVKAGAGLAGGVILLLTVFSLRVYDSGSIGIGLLQAAARARRIGRTFINHAPRSRANRTRSTLLRLDFS